MTHHLCKLWEDPEKLSRRLAVISDIFVDEPDQGGQDQVDIVALRFAVELFVEVESSLNLEENFTF